MRLDHSRENKNAHRVTLAKGINEAHEPVRASCACGSVEPGQENQHTHKTNTPEKLQIQNRMEQHTLIRHTSKRLDNHIENSMEQPSTFIQPTHEKASQTHVEAEGATHNRAANALKRLLNHDENITAARLVHSATSAILRWCHYRSARRGSCVRIYPLDTFGCEDRAFAPPGQKTTSTKCASLSMPFTLERGNHRNMVHYP